MKTAKELEVELSEVKQQIIEWDKTHDKPNRKLRKRIPFLKLCIMYMEENPSKEFMKSEIEKVENKINLRMVAFPLDEYMAKDPPMEEPTIRKLRMAHEKKYEVPHLREQARTLRFLLK